MDHRQPRLCKDCGRPWRIYSEPVPCPRPGDCWECDLFRDILGEEFDGTHADQVDDVDQAVSYQCPHGPEYSLLCRGCGARVSGWGAGAAGFGELCGCDGVRGSA